MPHIDSTAIKFADYRPELRELDLTFTSGGTYTFYGVPEVVYEEFLAAESQGEFYHKYIKNKFRSSE